MLIKNSSQPVDFSRAEYNILRVLWKMKRATVGKIHDRLQDRVDWAYTTTKSMMHRMMGKGLSQRERFHDIYLHEPRISCPAGLAWMVEFFANRVLETEIDSGISVYPESKSI